MLGRAGVKWKRPEMRRRRRMKNSEVEKRSDHPKSWRQPERTKVSSTLLFYLLRRTGEGLGVG